MRNSIRNIPLVLLWIAGLAMGAHMTIPHDHHSADSYLHAEDFCPGSTEKGSHSTGFPVHCQAFNDVASEKATPYCFIADISCQDVSAIGFSDLNDFFLPYILTPFVYIRIPFPDVCLLEIPSLRAPPLLS